MSTLLIWSLILIFLGGIGAILLAIDQFKGTEVLRGTITKSKDSIIESLELENSNLKNLVESKNKEVQDKQDRIAELTDSILKFSSQINAITSNTHEVATIIKNEQREKGEIEFISTEYNDYKLALGNTIHFEINDKDSKEPQRGYINGVSIMIIQDGNKFLVSTHLSAPNGDLIFELVENKWSLKKNSVFSVNHDKHGLEIIDNKGNVFLQINLVKSSFRVTGTFFNQYSVALLSDSFFEEVFYNDKNFEKKLNDHYLRLKKIFVHHGENYLGKRLGKE
ncbi:hypothetical protein K1F50_09535 [Muricauda oceani]|uniref:Uncharacterized protein n=1 Tax=Flagellimonas oceani TaxID=2698672 RepID=A0A6G7J6Z4_9FLAO|nr:hypothetical protein [Allomuricauda oceani]MBW8243040.1 hypothetical protein [Allomuricauda oceani]QII46605.1 hypothetical protein GVT53_18600 [Allomuricauda oceani]